MVQTFIIVCRIILEQNRHLVLSCFYFLPFTFFLFCFSSVQPARFILTSNKCIQKPNLNLKRNTYHRDGLCAICLLGELSDRGIPSSFRERPSVMARRLKRFHCTLFLPDPSYNLVEWSHALLFSLKSFMSAFIFYSTAPRRW